LDPCRGSILVQAQHCEGCSSAEDATLQKLQYYFAEVVNHAEDAFLQGQQPSIVCNPRGCNSTEAANLKSLNPAEFATL
jgi:hypothetical protein